MKNNKIAFNAFIFAGSFSIGVMDAGFDLKGVLEISDTMLQENAFYFHKNYPNIPVVLPKEWENDAYLDNMKQMNIDLMCCNCPCSSLSRVNRYVKDANGANNKHFYRLFNVFKHVQPKVFAIENAPTLIQVGFPILKSMEKELGGLYRFTLVRDLAGNHDVCMKRMRTIVFGWRRDVFSQTPVVDPDKHKQMSIKDAIGDLYESDLDDACPWEVVPIKPLLKYSIPGFGILASLAKRYIAGDEDCIKDIEKYLPGTVFEKTIFPNTVKKIRNGEGFWDKSPKRMREDQPYPSISGPQQYLHPVKDRCLNSLEIKRMMGYPDSFDVSDPKKECKVDFRVAMAQGVPVNFGKWVAKSADAALDGKPLRFVDSDIIFQNNSTGYLQKFTSAQFQDMEKIDPNAKSEKI